MKFLNCQQLSVAHRAPIISFIAGYSVRQYLKRSKPCNDCLYLLTVDKEFLLDFVSESEFKLLQLTDRGGLKYPSQHVLNSILILWKIFFAIESDRAIVQACKLTI